MADFSIITDVAVLVIASGMFVLAGGLLFERKKWTWILM